MSFHTKEAREKRLAQFRRLKSGIGKRRTQFRGFESRLPSAYRPTVLGRRQLTGLKRGIVASDDYKLLQKGFFGHFARNPIGTMVGLIMFFLMMDFFGSSAGPFSATSGTSTDIQAEFLVFYNNSNWILTMAFVLLPVALAYGFLTGGIALPESGFELPKISRKGKAKPKEKEEEEVKEQLKEESEAEEESEPMSKNDFDGT